jgi:hypothetical protein
MSLPPSVVEFRARYRATEIGQHYSGAGHFAFTSLLSLALITVAALGVHAPSLAELATVPLTFLFANAAEYFGHKGPMHHPRAGLGLVYKRHTQQHHHFFTDEAMSYESARDVKMVLFPPVLIVFFFGFIALPIGVVLWLLATENVARLFVATAIGYFLTYEWLHFSYHLGPDTFIGRRAIVRRLRRHHMTHHDLALMNRYNFNITFPICDTLFKTLKR